MLLIIATQCNQANLLASPSVRPSSPQTRSPMHPCSCLVDSGPQALLRLMPSAGGHLTSLTVIGTSSFRSTANGLHQLTDLKSLTLINCEADALQQVKVTSEVTIEETPVVTPVVAPAAPTGSPPRAAAIAVLTGLTSLELNNSFITRSHPDNEHSQIPVPLRDLAPLTNLENLNLSNNRVVVDPSDAPILRSLSRLTSFDVSGCRGLGQSSMAAIAEAFSHLRVLSMQAANKMEGAAILPLAAMVGLTCLKVGGNNCLGDVGAATIAAMLTLESLDTSSCGITAQGAVGLSALTALTHLDLGGNSSVTGDGALHHLVTQLVMPLRHGVAGAQQQQVGQGGSSGACCRLLPVPQKSVGGLLRPGRRGGSGIGCSGEPEAVGCLQECHHRGGGVGPCNGPHAADVSRCV